MIIIGHKTLTFLIYLQHMINTNDAFLKSVITFPIHWWTGWEFCVWKCLNWLKLNVLYGSYANGWQRTIYDRNIYIYQFWKYFRRYKTFWNYTVIFYRRTISVHTDRWHSSPNCNKYTRFWGLVKIKYKRCQNKTIFL